MACLTYRRANAHRTKIWHIPIDASDTLFTPNERPLLSRGCKEKPRH